MSKLLFVAWMVLFPIASALSTYLRTMSLQISGRKHLTENEHGFGALVELVFYIWIAVKLWRLP